MIGRSHSDPHRHGRPCNRGDNRALHRILRQGGDRRNHCHSSHGRDSWRYICHPLPYCRRHKLRMIRSIRLYKRRRDCSAGLHKPSPPSAHDPTNTDLPAGFPHHRTLLPREARSRHLHKCAPRGPRTKHSTEPGGRPRCRPERDLLRWFTRRPKSDWRIILESRRIRAPDIALGAKLHGFNYGSHRQKKQSEDDQDSHVHSFFEAPQAAFGASKTGPDYRAPKHATWRLHQAQVSGPASESPHDLDRRQWLQCTHHHGPNPLPRARFGHEAGTRI